MPDPRERHYRAMVQFRTTFDQAGQVAGLAGELGISESDVWRRLASRALDDLGGRALDEIRAQLAAERRKLEQDLERAQREGRVPADVEVSHLVVGSDAS